MTAKDNTLADAPLAYALALNWDSIGWRSVVAHVRQLQLRIAKAFQQGKHRRAKALQWILTPLILCEITRYKKGGF